MKSPILGSSYVARSVNAADNRMVNLFPEIIPEGGKEPAFLQRCPGLTLWNTVGAGPIAGMHAMTDGNGYPLLLIVSGQNLYRSTAGAAPVLVGGVPFLSNTGVNFADNGTQVMIASVDLAAYIYNINTNALVRITDGDFPGARTVAYLDGFFVFNVGYHPTDPTLSQQVWCSDLLDGTSVTPLNFASAEASPDGVIAVCASFGELWVFGADTTEVWYNAGTAGFPFAPIKGAYMETGCVSADTVQKLDNTIFWLGRDARGQGIVYKANGYRAERVSSHALEWQLYQYSQSYDLNTIRAFTYQQNGHAFYVLCFPETALGYLTWVYDVATGVWHERASYSAGTMIPHRGNCSTFAFNKNMVGDRENGKVYYFDPTLYSDAGTDTKWLRSWRALPSGQNNLKRTAHHSLQLDCETGVQNAGEPVADPQITLKWSDDGGHTWSNGTTISMGASGNYSKRVIWRRLGMTMKLRDRVYEVSGTDPVSIIINGAELIMSPTNA